MSASYPRHLATLFSPNKLRGFVRGERDVLRETYETAGYSDVLGNCETVGQVFDGAYAELARTYRSEYVYKNEIAQHLLLGEHDADDAVLLTELRVGTSKADAVVVNGTSTVYEIKTDLDKFDRLAGQLSDYAAVFDRVNVVVSEARAVEATEATPESVGVLVLTESMKFETLRAAASGAAMTSPTKAIEVLRKREYGDAVAHEFGARPDVPSGLFFEACREAFGRMAPIVAHRHIISALRRRAVTEERLRSTRNLPPSLLVAGLTYAMKDEEVDTLSLLCDRTVS